MHQLYAVYLVDTVLDKKSSTTGTGPKIKKIKNRKIIRWRKDVVLFGKVEKHSLSLPISMPSTPCPAPSGRGSIVAPGKCCSSRVVYGLCHSHSLLNTYNHLGSGHRLISSPSTRCPAPPGRGSIVAPGKCCSSRVVYGLCHSHSLLITYNHLGLVFSMQPISATSWNQCFESGPSSKWKRQKIRYFTLILDSTFQKYFCVLRLPRHFLELIRHLSVPKIWEVLCSFNTENRKSRNALRWNVLRWMLDTD